MKKIGLFGGTFDPPHIGHLLLAMEVKTELELDEVWFIPTYTSPHKEVGTKAQHRVAMVKEAIDSYKNFKVNEIEIERKGKSYTYETILALKEAHPNVTFYFLIGGDMVESIRTWYKYEELTELVHFVGVRRTGYKTENSFGIPIINIPLVDVSSTAIRERRQNHLPITYYVTDRVEQYIREHRLYESE